MTDLLRTYGIAVLGWAAAALLLGLYVGAKEDVVAERERCNTEKLMAVQEATEMLRNAELAAYEARVAELEQIALDESRARQIAQEAALRAENRPERVRTVIREVASADACINTVMPTAVIDSLRD